MVNMKQYIIQTSDLHMDLSQTESMPEQMYINIRRALISIGARHHAQATTKVKVNIRVFTSSVQCQVTYLWVLGRAL